MPSKQRVGGSNPSGRSIRSREPHRQGGICEVLNSPGCEGEGNEASEHRDYAHDRCNNAFRYHCSALRYYY